MNSLKTPNVKSNIFYFPIIIVCLLIVVFIPNILRIVIQSFNESIYNGYNLHCILLFFCSAFMFVRKISFSAIMGDWGLVIKNKSYFLLLIPTFIFSFSLLFSVIYCVLFIKPSLSKNIIDTLNSMDAKDTSISTGFYFFFFGFVGPIIEEIAFRGLLLHNLLKRVSPFRAIFISSLIFALVHPGTLMVPQFLIGCILALMYLRTHSLILCITFHSLNNSILEILLRFSDNEEMISMEDLQSMISVAPYAVITTIFSLGSLLYFITKLMPVSNTKTPYDANLFR